MMQVSHRGGSPLYFWPNYSRESARGPTNCDQSPPTEAPERASLSFSPHLFCVPLSLSVSSSLRVSSFPLVISFLRLPGARCTFPFSLDTIRRFPLSRSSLAAHNVVVSLSPSCAPFFLFRSLPLCVFLCLFSSFLSLSLSLYLDRSRQIGSRRPAVKFILLPCTATMIAAFAF